MARMQQVIAAVGEDDGLTLLFPEGALAQQFILAVKGSHGYQCSSPTLAESGPRYLKATASYCRICRYSEHGNTLQLKYGNENRMIESSTESAVGTWSAPECPYTIEYSPRVLDDIRLAVVDALYSLPRGGAEIGGILLGRFADGRISTLEYQALDCEHAMGPSFTLSQNDQTQLADFLAAARQHPDGMRPVGWYHSHTRSDIFLSDADQDIHKRFFPEPWQIALVLKPSTFEPTRGGFFFREADGSIRGSASYQEFVVEAQPIRQVPTGNPPQMPPAPQPLRREAEARGPVITLMPEAQPEPEPEPESEVAPEPVVETAPPGEEAAETEQESPILQ